MAKHLLSGQYGEQLALGFVQKLGYNLLDTNWRYRYWEVDIVAMDGDVLVFIEVKSRTNTAFGEPVEFVDWKKRNNLIKLAEAYIKIKRFEGEIRFDIISVYLKTKEVELIKDAFWSN
ncbi:YraN family protein [Sphingobacterium tabacisoli]|uniref:UPF0102 protein ACFSQW_07780 n=1 Tax=Sphingobacterium tabacisoli TaxID=2044855 RepID=A0ABW5L2P3_9SPHI|nr:YraN family protein [Sphingobacterium tabacisoli]